MTLKEVVHWLLAPGIKRRIVAVAFFLCAGIFIHAQDSALSAIQRMPEDTIKVNKLLSYGTALMDKDDTTALRLFEQALKMSEQLQYDEGRSFAYKRIGYVKISLGDFAAGIEANKIALDYFKRKKNLINIIGAYNNIAQAFRQMDKVDSAITYYLFGIQAVENAMLENDAQAKQVNVQSVYALLNTNISSLYCLMQDLPKAMEYGHKAIRVAGSVNDTSKMVMASLVMGHIYEVRKNFTEGMKYARDAVSLAKSMDNPMISTQIFHLLSVCYTGIGLADSAILAGRQAMYYAKGHDPQEYVLSLLDIADGYHLKKAYKEEEAILREGVKMFGSVNNQAFYGRYIYEKLANAKYAQGDYKAAFDFLGKANVYKDSLLSKENRDAVAKLETQYKTVQKEKELALKDFQLQKNRNYMYYMYFAIAALIVALVIVALLIAQRRSKRKLHEGKLESIQRQKELQLLQALMQGEERERSRIAKDLHDGVAGMLAAVKMHFSSMPAADEMAETEGYRQGMNLLNEATQEIRKTSHNLMPEVLLLHGLDEALSRFCANVNNSRGLHIQYDSWGDIDRFVDGFELSVYRIVQELINNVLKHSKATQAIVQLAQQSNLLTISIEDNGVGFATTEGKDGMGLRSLQNRIRAMNGKLEVETSEQTGVSAYLEFDVADLKKETTLAL